jgi:hypothetical protein
MARYDSGIFGSISGKLGTVVGATWRGISYLRSKPDKKRRKKRPSRKQLAQRLKFKVAGEFLWPLTDLVPITFRTNEAITALNNATRYTMKNALTGTYPDIVIDYALVRISRGDLPAALSPAVSKNGSELTFTWTPNSRTGSAADTDKAVLVVYCPAMKQCVHSVGDANRAAGSVVVDASDYTGEVVHTYLAFVSNDEEEASDSVYTGSVQL